MQEMQFQLGQKYLLEEGTSNPSNILFWRIPQTEEPGTYSLQGSKEFDTTEATQHAQAAESVYKNHTLVMNSQRN